ncbi:MAG: hypothetical protein KatS3mg040_1598 [Candidatus Kapaibacterium sp.]|nr:MAG: hypothetical protein KatS3mg040_1598 [Candidatus Kapabacteria bacterium]
MQTRTNLAAIVALSLLAGCSSSVRFTSSAPSNALTALQRQVLEVSASHLGTPYCAGGSRERCFDCSGYVQAVFAAVGVYLPRTTLQQSQAGMFVPTEQLRAGDLVFFRFERRTGVSHVGIYAGDGTIFHASQSRGVVREQLWGTYLEQGITFCRRVLPRADGGMF